MAYKINSTKCVGCGSCAPNCPCEAIKPADGKYSIDPAMCQSCGTCATACPLGLIAEDKENK